MAYMARQRVRKRPMADINVVPYIDVMLVLLVIFMITAPLLTQGVKVELPKADAEVVESANEEPLIVTVDAAGNYHLNIGNDSQNGVGKGIGADVLKKRVATVLRRKPKIQVLVRGDKDVNYGKVIRAMTLLKQAGVESVGLVTEPADTTSR